VTVAKGGRTDVVRFVGEVDNSLRAIERTIKKLEIGMVDSTSVLGLGRRVIGYGGSTRSWSRLHSGCAGPDPVATGRARQDHQWDADCIGRVPKSTIPIFCKPPLLSLDYLVRLVLPIRYGCVAA